MAAQLITLRKCYEVIRANLKAAVGKTTFKLFVKYKSNFVICLDVTMSRARLAIPPTHIISSTLSPASTFCNHRLTGSLIAILSNMANLEKSREILMQLQNIQIWHNVYCLYLQN